MPPGAADRYRHFREAVEGIERIGKDPLNSLKSDPARRAAAERFVQKCTEVLIDLANYLLAQNNWEKPRTAVDIFRVLEDQAVVSPELRRRMEQRVRFRNFIIHEYAVVTVDALHEAMQDLTDFLEMASILADRLNLDREI